MKRSSIVSCLLSLVISVSVSLSGYAFHNPLLLGLMELNTKEKQMRSLRTLADYFETHYGLLEYKEKTLNVNLDDMLARYGKLIINGLPVESFYKDKNQIDNLPSESTNPAMSSEDLLQLLIAFSVEFNDGHVKVTKNNDSGAKLGLTLANVENKAVVVDIDRAYISATRCPVQPGDIVIKINGEDTEEVLKKLLLYVGFGNEETNRNLATHFLVSRPGDRFKVPTGESILTFGKADHPEVEIYSCNLSWIGSELVEFGNLFKSIKAAVNVSGGPQYVNLPIGSSFVESPFLQYLQRKGVEYIDITEKLAPQGFQNISNRAIVFTYQAIVPTDDHEEKKNIRLGYLRIPSFDQPSNATDWYRKVMLIMEKNTDALIIDEINNPGGKLSFLTNILELFASKNKPLKTPSFQLRLSDNNIQGWLQEVKPSQGADLGTLQQWQDLKSFLQGWQRKGNLMSEPIPFVFNVLEFSENKKEIERFGIVRTSENVQPYTKPVVVLMNRGSGSCGDFFPAILKDNDRAMLFGETTMGLGGPVLGITQLPLSEISVQAPVGPAMRLNGEYIENNGVKPDVEHKISLDDLNNGYQNYVKEFLDLASQKALSNLND